MKTLNEYINESIIANLMGGMIGLIIGAIVSVVLNLSLGGEEIRRATMDEIKYFWGEKKARKIIERLSKDSDIKEFFNLPRTQQRGKWTNLLKSKLSEEEYKYIKHITKDKVNSKIDED